mmetsp:Transcript_126906/g.406375  ORF Transcript_126906/g.406375 Transcript_126906/m.406375 type:complete len:98 (-) Transcript_126906:371-664(-)
MKSSAADVDVESEHEVALQADTPCCNRGCNGISALVPVVALSSSMSTDSSSASGEHGIKLGEEAAVKSWRTTTTFGGMATGGAGALGEFMWAFPVVV